MSKKNLFQLLSFAFFIMLNVYLLSCGKDEEQLPKDDFEQTETLSVQDPEGTIVGKAVRI